MGEITKSQKWFIDNVSENVKELEEIGELANSMLYNKISLSIPNPKTTIAIYAEIFNTICSEIRSFEADYDEFDLNIADRLHIGFTTTTSEDDEKAGNFMVYIQDDPNKSYSDENLDDEAGNDTIVLCTEWNATNVQVQTDIIKNIASTGLKALSNQLNIKSESHEFVIPLFCIIHSAILSYIRLKRVELNLDEYELNIAGLYTVGIRTIADEEDVQEEVYYIPSISLKLFFKDDAIATGKNE